MIRHIVMFRLKDEPEKHENIQKLKEAIEKLEEFIPEAKSIEVGVNINEKPSAYDLVLVSEFEDEDALERYRVHPEHQKVVEFIKEVNEDIAAVDYHI
ncbi:MAG: Dabb family protein [Bacteroidales bacterium]